MNIFKYFKSPSVEEVLTGRQKALLNVKEKLEKSGINVHVIKKDTNDIYQLVYVENKKLCMRFEKYPSYTIQWDIKALPQLADVLCTIEQEMLYKE